MLKSNGMTHEYLAVSYRTEGSSMGCWKGFKTELEARNWLRWRSGKTPTSPKGTAVYASIEAVQRVLGTTTCRSLKLGLLSYVNFLKYLSRDTYSG